MNFIGNLQAVDNSGNTSTDVSLKPDVTGLTSLGIANSSTTASNLTSTANGNFTTGAGTGFYYGGATGSLVGANTISSTGTFTGTLFALTADSTTTGTILGISGQNLATGKAIDVSLGAAYNLAADAKGTAGAVNVRAGAYNGNIFNVLSTGNSGATTMNLANLESGQTDGQLLKVKTTFAYAGSAGTGIVNIDANTATGGTIARITATSLTGASQALSISLGAGSAATTAILANTSSPFVGSLIDLQSNSVSQFKVDASNTTVRSLLGSNGTSFSIDETGARPINIGGTTASQVNIARSGVLTNVGGTLTVASTLTVTGTTPASALVVSGSTGNLTAQGIGTFGPNAGNQLVVQGAASGTGVQLRATGFTDANVAISISPAGTGRVTIVGGSGGLDVQNTIVAGSTQTNKLTFAGAASTFPVTVSASGVDTNITLQLTPKGAGTVQINGTGGISGPTAAALVIDATGAQNINIGDTSATTLNLGRSGQLQALLGNVTVGGTLGVTGDLSVNSTKFNVTASTGAVAFLGDLAINTSKFTVAAATGNTVIGGTLIGNNATGFLIDASGAQPISIGGTSGTTTLNLSRTGQMTNVLGNLTVFGNLTITSIGHIQTLTTLVPTPTSNTGTTCTIVTNGTDTAGQLQVVTTSGLGANQVMCTITFASAYSGYGPTVIITPAETNSAGLANTKAPFVSSVTTTAWTLKSNGTSMAAATYIWNYVVIR